MTVPYLHNGAYVSLEDTVRHHLNPEASLRSYEVSQLSPDLRAFFQGDEDTISRILANLDPILLGVPELSDEEIQQLLAFLKSLEDPVASLQFTIIPEVVPSGITTGY